MVIKVLAFVFVVVIFIITRNCYSRNKTMPEKKAAFKKVNAESINSQPKKKETKDDESDDIKHRFMIYADGIENKMDSKRVEYYFNGTEGIFAKCDSRKGVLALIAKRDIQRSEIEAIAELAGIKITKIEEK